MDLYASCVTHVAWDASNATKNALGGNFRNCSALHHAEDASLRQMKDFHTCPKFFISHHKLRITCKMNLWYIAAIGRKYTGAN